MCAHLKQTAWTQDGNAIGIAQTTPQCKRLIDLKAQ